MHIPYAPITLNVYRRTLGDVFVKFPKWIRNGGWLGCIDSAPNFWYTILSTVE
ncbi:predicted protein [Botrytis cinerea T4]|nr:predicted protein [Botrytis cinerea T4]